MACFQCRSGLSAERMREVKLRDDMSWLYAWRRVGARLKSAGYWVPDFAEPHPEKAGTPVPLVAIFEFPALCLNPGTYTASMVVCRIV